MTTLVKIYKCEHCGRICRIRVGEEKYCHLSGFESEFVYNFDPTKACVFFGLSKNSNFKLEMDYEE